jgi:hypothetical protein
MNLNKPLLVALMCAFVITAGPNASAAVDKTRPTLALPPTATFVSGTTIGAMARDEDGYVVETRDIQMNARWTASDASGICGSSHRRVYAGLDPDPWSAWSSSMSFTYGSTDYDDQQGGGSGHVDGYDVRVRDCAQNISTGFVSNFPAVYQENGTSYGYGTLARTYTGIWGASTCTCWSGGRDRWTNAPGARVNFVLPSGGPVALVMEKAANRGKAKILVDGVLRVTIDTHAATARHRSVVWAATLSSARHTVSVVNAATPGRPRIDVDAVMAN